MNKYVMFFCAASIIGTTTANASINNHSKENKASSCLIDTTTTTDRKPIIPEICHSTTTNETKANIVPALIGEIGEKISSDKLAKAQRLIGPESLTTTETEEVVLKNA